MWPEKFGSQNPPSTVAQLYHPSWENCRADRSWSKLIEMFRSFGLSQNSQNMYVKTTKIHPKSNDVPCLVRDVCGSMCFVYHHCPSDLMAMLDPSWDTSQLCTENSQDALLRCRWPLLLITKVEQSRLVRDVITGCCFQLSSAGPIWSNLVQSGPQSKSVKFENQIELNQPPVNFVTSLNHPASTTTLDQIGSDWIRLDQIGSDWISHDFRS